MARYEFHQERPMIHAQKYMILRSPAEFEGKLSAGASLITCTSHHAST
jgi:hypothetical protein